MFNQEIKKETLKILVEEHRNILRLAEALEQECLLIEQGKEVDENFFTGAINFIKNYADKFHHAKEEDILFKKFEQCAQEGCLHCNPVEQMLFEHEAGRKFVKGLQAALADKNKEELVRNAKGYVNLIKEHIFKEDSILYPLADETLNEEAEKEMLTEFKKVAEANQAETEKNLAFVNKLEIEKYGKN